MVESGRERVRGDGLSRSVGRGVRCLGHPSVPQQSVIAGPSSSPVSKLPTGHGIVRWDRRL